MHGSTGYVIETENIKGEDINYLIINRASACYECY